MADDLNTEIKIGADASGVEAGVGRAKRSLASLGDSAKKAGKDAGDGIASMGAGGDKAAKDVERATKNIQGQLQRAIASFEAGEKGSRKFYESIARQRGVDVNTIKPLLDQLDAYKSKSEAAAQASAKVGTSFTGLSTAAGLAARAVAAIGITASVGEFVRMADASTNVASRLGLVTSSAAELASVQARLFGIAQSSRVSFTDLVGTYAQVARSTKDLGVSQTALLGVIQTISQAVTISGGSAASAQAALTQLSQGFASGALRGEELNSILEQTPRLAQALADGLGVGVGKLRELGQAGELTSEKVLGALEKSAAGVAAEFGKMAVTVEQASTNAANSVLRLVGAFDRLLGVTSAIGGAIQTISNAVDFLSSDVEKLGNQGPLRDAYREVLNLDAAAHRLRTGMQSGVLGPNAQGELDRINARLAEAKQRFRELDQQLSGVRDPRDQSGFTGRGASYANEAARQAKLREDANAFRLNQSGVPASYLKDMAELIRLNQAGVIVGKEYTDALKAQQDVLLKKTGAVKGSAAAANAEQNAYESLISSISAKIEADKLEIAGGAALTESQRIRIKLDQDLAAGRVKLSAQNERAVRLALQELSASEASALAAKTLAKANLDAAASREKYITSLATGLDKIQADITAQIEATERMGLSKEAIADLDAAKLEMLATDLELQAIKAMDRNLDQQTYDALKKQAAAYRELGIAKKGGAAKEAALDMEKANAEAAKKAQEDWERASEQINSTLTDALMRGFESGKDFAKNLRDTVVNMFKTMVLRPVVSAIVSPISQGITGLMGLSGAAQAGQGGALSTLGSIGSGYSMLSSLGTFGGGLSAGFGGLMGSLGLSATGATFGGAMSAGSIAMGAGNIAGGLGTLAGALGPIALAVGLLSSLIKKSTPHMGAASSYSEAGGMVSNADIYQNVGFRDARTYNAEAASVTGNVAKAIGDTLNSTAKAFGKTAGYEITTAFADDSSKDGAWGSLIIKQMGEAVLDWRDTQTSEWAPKEFADGEAGQKEYLSAIAKSTRDALDAIDLPGWADDMLATLGDSPSLEGLAQTVDQINAASVALGKMRQNLDGFGGLTESAVSALVKAAGGMDSLIASASSYYDNFYSEAEKTANVTRDVASALADVGLQMPATRQEFRALVEAQMALGESGTKAVAALLGVAGAFASVTAAAVRSEQAAERADRLAAQRALEKQAAEALQKQIEAYSEGAEQFNTLRDSLLKAGDAAGLLAAVTERAFADPSGKYELPRWESTDTAASFNFRYGEMQARMRQQLGDEASANALRIQDVRGVLQSYSVEQMMGEYNSVTGAVKLAVQQAIVDASGDLGYAVRDAVQGAALYAAMADVRGQFTSSGPGLASIAAARATAADASRTSIDPATGLYRIGGAAVEYGKALDNLQGAMNRGSITADSFERAVEALGSALPGAAESIGTLEDAISAAQGAAYIVGTAGVNSIRHYFGSLAELTAEFAKAAADAQEPIAQTTAAIGRLNSAQYAFAESASAALQGFGGAGESGRQALAVASQDISRAQMIAEAAGIASAAMTTADAAAAAAKLAQSPAFAELTAQGIRDASLLLDGVGQYSADGFERAFVRISDALAKGNVTEAQYKALFDTALDMFNGVPEETRTLIDSMTRLRDAMSGFADGLLIDEQRTTLSAGATLAEMQRQYAQAFAGASTGDSEAIGKYQQLATTLLDKDLYSTRAEYNAAFGSVYGDARQLETIGVNTLANAQGNAMVSELKDMNAKLNKRVEDLEKNLIAALAQIAKNTSDTSRGIEQQIVIAEATP